jgi:hypothetical protein
MSIVWFHRPIATFVVALAMLSPAPEARAEACGNVGSGVECLDPTTLGWCDHGKLETLFCPEGEICTSHPAFEGGYGCVPLEDTACADIPPEGLCTSANVVVWCNEEGDVKLKGCDEGTLCSWDTAENWYDCLPATMQSFPEDASAPSISWDTSMDTAHYDAGSGSPADLGPLADDVPGQGADAGPTPSVSAGGAGDGNLATTQPGAGCAGAPSGSAWALALAIASLIWIRRSVSHNLDGGRAS